MAEEHINPEDVQATPVADAATFGVDQASFDKYYKDGDFNWQGYSKELEFKMSQSKAPAEAAPAQAEAAQAADAQAAVSNAGLDWDVLSDKITNSGDLEASDYEALSAAGIPEDIARNYIDMTRQTSENMVNDVMASFGGPEQFEIVFGEVMQNVDLDGRNRIDALLRDPLTRPEGVALAHRLANVAPAPAAAPAPAPAQPVASRGNPGVAPTSTQGYGSMEEMSLAMRDSRYTTDPVYRAEVERRAMGASFSFNPRGHTGGL